MEERTQIKFENPDIEGNPKPQLINLEQETPVEGVSEREDGESFTWHKWLVTNDQYFMASDSLDGMLKLIPSKMGTVLKIQKVENPKGGFPFFEINGMNKDKLIAQATDAAPSMEPINPMPNVTTQVETMPSSNTEGAISANILKTLIRFEQKLDKVTTILQEMNKKEALPF